MKPHLTQGEAVRKYKAWLPPPSLSPCGLRHMLRRMPNALPTHDACANVSDTVPVTQKAMEAPPQHEDNDTLRGIPMIPAHSSHMQQCTHYICHTTCRMTNLNIAEPSSGCRCNGSSRSTPGCDPLQGTVVSSGFGLRAIAMALESI